MEDCVCDQVVAEQIFTQNVMIGVFTTLLLFTAATIYFIRLLVRLKRIECGMSHYMKTHLYDSIQSEDKVDLLQKNQHILRDLAETNSDVGDVLQLIEEDLANIECWIQKMGKTND